MSNQTNNETSNVVETLEFYATPFAIPPFLCVPLPENSADFLDTTGSVQVRGVINNIPFQLSAYPAEGDRHFFMLPHQIQAQAAIIMGEEAFVIIEKPKIEPIEPNKFPVELKEALNDGKISTAFEKLSPREKRKLIESLKKLRSKKAKLERIQRLLFNSDHV